VAEKLVAISKLSQADFEKLFSEKDIVVVEDMKDYSNGEMFDAVIGIFQKIEIMGSKDPDVRKITREIISGLQAHDLWGEFISIIAWVKKNIRYTGDGLNIEQVQHPRTTLREKSGDCDCMAALACSMLRSIGHESGIALINSKGEADVDHAIPCISFRKDIVRVWGVRSSSGKIQSLPKELIDKIPMESKVPLDIVKGVQVSPTGDSLHNWIMGEVTEKFPVGWVPPKASYCVIISPEFVSRIEIDQKAKGN
jgi:hypothetical protein